MWLLLAIFALAALVRVGLVERHSLWADEVFSLAIATGHSLEHPAATADPALGDFVEPEGPVYAEEFKRYLAHESPRRAPPVSFAQRSSPTPTRLFITCCFTAGRSLPARATQHCVYSRRLGR